MAWLITFLLTAIIQMASEMHARVYDAYKHMSRGDRQSDKALWSVRMSLPGEREGLALFRRPKPKKKTMGMMATMPIWPKYLSSAELAHHSPTVPRAMKITYACFHVMGSCRGGRCPGVLEHVLLPLKAVHSPVFSKTLSGRGEYARAPPHRH